MKNVDINFNFISSLQQENNITGNKFISKKRKLPKEEKINSFEDELNISEIAQNKDNNCSKIDNCNENNFTEELDKIDDDEFFVANNNNIIDFEIDIESIDDTQIKENNLVKKKTLDELNNTPLPIFDCFYCSNEKIAFNHFINNLLSNKYLLMTSKYDIKKIDNLMEKMSQKCKNIEFFQKFTKMKENDNFFNSSNFKKICSGCMDEIKKIIRKKCQKFIQLRTKIISNQINNKLKNSELTISNNNIYFDGEDSYSLNRDIKQDMTIKKFSKNDILWEENHYDIWNPQIDDSLDEEDNNDNTILNESGNILNIKFVNTNYIQSNKKYIECIQFDSKVNSNLITKFTSNKT